MITVEQIRVGATAATKNGAIILAGQVLVDNGIVEPSYIMGMLAREEVISTYLGNGVAIPHGTHDNAGDINRTGISVVQVPDGVVWGDDEVAYLLIGIAANSDEHIGILSNLAEILEEEEDVKALVDAADPQFILERLAPQPA